MSEKNTMEVIAIPKEFKGFRVTKEQFEQLAWAEQLARMELSKLTLLGFSNTIYTQLTAQFFTPG